MTLTVPDVGPDDDTASAALKYAAAGWYVLPIDVGTKKPAAELGRNWGAKSSRDPGQIIAWFAGTSYGVGLHVGRSGVAAFDVDNPGAIPEPLARAIGDSAPPYQQTRPDDDPGRGHYLFTFRNGRVLGNGTGRLGGAWGEIRGRGGQIVVAPTPHTKGGRYQWYRTGDVPELPAYVDELLSDAEHGEDVATDAEVRRFLETYTESTRPDVLAAWVSIFERKVAEGESRHDRMISVAAGAFKEARAGLFTARAAMEALEAAFIRAVERPPVPGSQQRPPRPASAGRHEWRGISAWAVAQAEAANVAEVRARTTEKMPDGDDYSWVIAGGGTATPPAPAGDPGEFFDRQHGLRAVRLVESVTALGPVATDHGGAMYRYDGGVWLDDGERVVRRRTAELLGDRYRMAHAANVVDILRSAEPAFSDEWDTEYLNLPNGLLEWRTGRLRPHDPAVPSVVRIPITWDPDARCPEVERWLAEVFPPDALDFIAEVIGYALLNDNPLHKAVLLFGRGRNGKGTFLRLLRALVGPRNVSAVTPQSLDENRFRAAELYGKLANLVGDVDPRVFRATETFKQITGGDTIVAERKYGQPFRFYCRALMVAAFNALPRTSDTSEGFFSRWIVVPFTNYFPPGVADPGREPRMHTDEELRGLLVLAVRGLERLMRRGYFDLPESVERETDTFRRVADQVRAWLEEWLPLQTLGWIPRTTVYREYHNWALSNGHNALSAAAFYERVESISDLPSHFITASKRQGTRGYNLVDKGAAGAGATPFPLCTRYRDAQPAPLPPNLPPNKCSCGWGPGAVACRCEDAS